jgi:bifunctional enzyme CysN/CysC
MLIGEERFLVVHVATSIDVCRARDTKGQYKQADEGNLPNFPGVTAKYEAPAEPDLVLDAAKQNIDTCADAVIELLRSKNKIK